MCIGVRLPVINAFSLRLSRGFYAIILFLFPLPTIFLSCAIDYGTVKCSEAQFRSWQLDSAVPLSRLAPSKFAPSIFAPFSSLSDVSLGDVMAWLQCMDARLDTLSIELY